jgi:hypothetical protein
MIGLKYKLAHKRAEKEKWNASDHSQKKRLIQILKELIHQLEGEMVVECWIEFKIEFFRIIL